MFRFSGKKANGRPSPPVAAARTTPPVANARGPQFAGERSRTLRQFAEDDTIDGEADSAVYSFAYEVNSEESGAQFSQSEDAADGVITGEYRVNLPDGRVQIVRYFYKTA